jgi:hypothetical protein
MKVNYLSLALTAMLLNLNTQSMDKLIKIAPQIPKYAAVALGMEAGTTACHEMGHGIAYQSFFDNLHGFSFFGKPVVQGQVGNLHISVGANPLGKSKAVVGNIAIEDSTYKLAAITSVVAGPLTGALATCLIKKGLSKTSLNQKVVTYMSRFVHANNLSSFIPVSRNDKHNPGAVIVSDGKYIVNLCTAYKNNEPCDLAGNVLLKKQ